ncbi:phage tail tape measure protein [Lelliottia amnigena]|uniref:phage tail tape measure protein n=1 Tax=Lelliottia amnigena TaxID=61646 RepID=UPI001157C375
MSNDIATISLRVNTTELERGSRELDRFQDTATAAAGKADDLNSTFRTGVDNQKKNSESLKQQRQELKNLLNKISPVNKALDELDSIQESLAKYRGKGLVDDEDFTRYNSVLETTRTKLAQIMEAETAEGRARIEQAQAAQRAAASGKTFIASLEEQTAAIGKTRAEILELKAAQLGVTQQAAPMIAKLKEQENVWKNGAISAGQYRNAMRYLPMQMTDIATSLASGMPIYMVAIQQGGQLRDTFGGVGNALKAILSLVTPAKLALGGMIGVAGLLVAAWYKGSQEASEYNKQLILTGNYAGKTAAQLSALAKSLSGGGINQYAASSVLAQVVGSGKFDANKLETVSRAAVAMEQATGQAVDKTIANFQKLYAEPTQASQELNNQLHYLTAAQFEYIASLERRGDKEAAGQAAADAYSQAEQRRSQQILANLGLVERAALAARNAFKGMWDELLNIGRPEAPQDMLARMQADLADRESKLLPERQRMGYGYSYDTSSQDRDYDNRRRAQLAAIASLKAQINPMLGAITLQNDLNGAVSAGKEINEDAISAQQIMNRYLDAGTEAAEKRRQAQDELNKAIAENAKAARNGTATLWTAEDIAKARAGIEKLYRDPKTPTSKGENVSSGLRAEDSAQSELLALQAQLYALQKHKDLNDTISQQRKNLWTTEAKFQVLEEASRTRSLTKQEQSLLASKDQVLQLARQKALLGDQITAQEQLNKRMDTAQKYTTQMSEKQAALTGGAGMSDRQAQRKLTKSQLAAGWQNSGGSLADDGYQKQLKAAADYYYAEDQLRGDWLTGAKKGWSEFEDSATNVYGQMQNISQSAFTGMASTLTDFFTTGKASFTDFLTTFLKGIAQMLVQLAMVNSMKSAFGGTAVGAFFGFSQGGLVPAFDSGGYTGDGGKYQPKGVVHGGEFVFTKEATSAIGIGNLYAMMHGAQGYADGGYVGTAPMFGLQSAGSGGVTVQTSVVVQNQSSQQQTSGNDDAISRAYKQTIEQSVRTGIAKELQPGKLIWNAMKSR